MPAIHETDCETGKTVVRRMTKDEAAILAASQAEAQQRAEAEETARRGRAVDLALIAAHPDEHVQALVRLLGALPE